MLVKAMPPAKPVRKFEAAVATTGGKRGLGEQELAPTDRLSGVVAELFSGPSPGISPKK
jgi:hypothetical protein